NDGSETRVFVESFDADTGQREWVRSIERRTGTQQERGYMVRSAYIDEDRGRLHFMYFINNGRSYRDVIIDLEDGSVIRDRKVSNTVWNNTPINVVYPGGEYYFQLWNDRVEQRRVSNDSRVASYRPPGYSWMATMLVDFYGNVYVSGQLSNGNYFVASASGNSDVNEIGWIDGCEGLGSM
ncbi:hypothetical protein, partial [Thioalkalivibrio sp. ALgr3]|uniref:hypothetical protein n=1 Tax=Thioalkalivibrio sp. ALgr3 TaxID=1239292 RepID=UPI0018CBBCC2